MGNCCSAGLLSLVLSMMVSFCAVPRDVLDEILDLIESVSEGFPTYSYRIVIKYLTHHGYYYTKNQFLVSRCLEVGKTKSLYPGQSHYYQAT